MKTILKCHLFKLSNPHILSAEVVTGKHVSIESLADTNNGTQKTTLVIPCFPQSEDMKPVKMYALIHKTTKVGIISLFHFGVQQTFLPPCLILLLLMVKFGWRELHQVNEVLADLWSG